MISAFALQVKRRSHSSGPREAPARGLPSPHGRGAGSPNLRALIKGLRHRHKALPKLCIPKREMEVPASGSKLTFPLRSPDRRSGPPGESGPEAPARTLSPRERP